MNSLPPLHVPPGRLPCPDCWSLFSPLSSLHGTPSFTAHVVRPSREIPEVALLTGATCQHTLQLIIKEPAMLIYSAFCWDSWVFYLLLCPRLHLSFTTACVLLIIGIFFFSECSSDLTIDLKISWIPTCCATNIQNPTCMSTACQLGLGCNSLNSCLEIMTLREIKQNVSEHESELTGTAELHRSGCQWTWQLGSICQSGWGRFFFFPFFFKSEVT